MDQDLRLAIQQSEMLKYGVQSYLTARMSFRNRMLNAGMMNSFWAIEYFLLSSLCVKFRSLDELKSELTLHNLDVYWNGVISLHNLPSSIAQRFQPTISQVNAFYNLRYPELNDSKSKVIYVGSGKKPKMTDGEGNNVKVDQQYKIDLNGIDRFASFWLFHMSAYDQGSIGELLASYNGKETYKDGNKYSLYPPANYHGEKELT